MQRAQSYERRPRWSHPSLLFLRMATTNRVLRDLIPGKQDCLYPLFPQLAACCVSLPPSSSCSSPRTSSPPFFIVPSPLIQPYFYEYLRIHINILIPVACINHPHHVLPCVNFPSLAQFPFPTKEDPVCFWSSRRPENSRPPFYR